MSDSKTCRKCAVEKSLGEFYASPVGKHGVIAICKPCSRERRRQWYVNNREDVKARERARHFANRDVAREKRRAYYEENRAERIAAVRAYYQANRERICESERVAGKARRLRQHYGMSEAEWASLFAAQGDACAICGTVEPGHKFGWSTDHDHSCCPSKRTCGACIRGILCHARNTGLGQFRDNPTSLRAAADYIEATP